ncbi:hypothetical protein AOLI_G00116570 [Acnodon oligacanthus]
MEAGSLRRPVKVFGNVRDYPAERRTSHRDSEKRENNRRRGRATEKGFHRNARRSKKTRRESWVALFDVPQQIRSPQLQSYKPTLPTKWHRRYGNRSPFRFNSPPERFRRTAAGEAGARHLYEDLPAPSRLIYRCRFVSMKRSCGSGCYRERAPGVTQLLFTRQL